MAERAPRDGWPEFIALVLALGMAAYICLHELDALERRVEALESRAAWYRPETQEHERALRSHPKE